VSDINMTSGLTKFWNMVRKFKNSHYFKDSSSG